MSTTAVKSVAQSTGPRVNSLSPSQAIKVALWRESGLTARVRALPESRDVVVHLSSGGQVRGKAVIGPRGATDLILPGVDGAEQFFANVLLNFGQ